MAWVKNTKEEMREKMLGALGDIHRIILRGYSLDKLTIDLAHLCKLKHAIESGVEYDYSLFPSPDGAKTICTKMEKTEAELAAEREKLENEPDCCIWDDTLNKEVWVRPISIARINTHKYEFTREEVYCKTNEELYQTVLSSIEHTKSVICSLLSYAALDGQIDEMTSELMRHMEAAMSIAINTTEEEAFEFSAEEASERARKAAHIRHAKDPKQKAKAEVYDDWLIWRSSDEAKKSYKYNGKVGKTAFANSMQKKHERILESPAQIMQWMREWEKSQN